MRNTFRVSTNAVVPLLLGCAVAALGFTSASGVFEKDTSVTVGSLSGHADFNPSSGEYSLTSAGGEIGGKSDGFHYLWKRVTGDVAFNADAHFTGAESTGRNQAALMVRQSLDPDAAYAAAVLYGDGRNALQYRVDRGATARVSEFPAYADMASPVHLSLRRQGDSFKIFVGRVGKRGGMLPASAPITVTMNGPVYVGLAFASPAGPQQQIAGVFSNVLLHAPGAE